MAADTHEYRTTRVAVGRSQTRSRGVLGRRLQDVLGELVQTTAGTWITKPPSRCPNGHRLGPGEVLVGHQACLGHGDGHTTWTCCTCDQTVYGPRSNTHGGSTHVIDERPFAQLNLLAPIHDRLRAGERITTWRPVADARTGYLPP